jgi:transposase-like protein
MKNASAQRRTITVAQRAFIVQRILVDGWTSAEAAAAFGISEHQVDVWVADFRRSGMTSLRRAPGKTLAAHIVPLMISQPARGIALRIASTLRRLLLRERLSEPLPLQRLSDDRRGRE